MVEKIAINNPQLEKRVDGIVQQLLEYYPDGKVYSLNKLHKGLSNRVGEIWQELGYESRDAFFEAYGFEFVATEKTGSKGGRPTLDHEAIIAELVERYDGEEKPSSLGILIHENPDMKGQLKTLSNKANELFGQTLAKELKQRGLISGGSKDRDVSEDDIRELLDELSEKYADAQFKPNSMAELKADNADKKDVISAFNDRCRLIFGVTARKKLIELGIFEKPKGAVIDASDEEIEQAVDELGKLVFELDDVDKPKTLSDLQKAYPEQGEYIKAGKKKGLVDKGPLQQLGILAPTRALIKREGIRRAPADSLAKDYASLGRAGIIKPGDPDESLLPPNVVGCDVSSKVELREFIATVKGAAAKSLGMGDNVSIGVTHVKREWGDPFLAINIQTMPMTTLDLGPLCEGAINNSGSELSAFMGGEVISATHGEGLDAAQIRVRFLGELNRDTLAYALRELGVVSEKDVRGSMEWRFRIRAMGWDAADRNGAVAAAGLAAEEPTEGVTPSENRPDIPAIKINFENGPVSFGMYAASDKGNPSVKVELPVFNDGVKEAADPFGALGDDGAESGFEGTSQTREEEPEEKESEEAALRAAEEERLRKEREQQKALEEQRRREEEEAVRKAEEERLRREAEEAERKRIEEERRKAEEERKRQEEAARKADEERKRQEEEAARKAEEKALAQKKFFELDAKLKKAEQRRASLAKPEKTVSEKEAEKIKAEIGRMETELGGLGFFARSKKKELQASISTKQSLLSQVKAKIPAEREAAESKRKAALAEADNEIRAIESEAAPYRDIVLEDVAKAFDGKKAGDSVFFGTYKQESSSAKAEPIEWIVLEAQGGRMLLLSKYVLANRKFNSSQSSGSGYASSDVCKWLKGAFAAEAFTAVDKQFLEGDPYILDSDNLKKYLRSDSERQCKPTKLAVSQGAEAASYYKVAGNTFYWVATSDGNERSYNVNPHGAVLGGGGFAYVDGTSIGNYGMDVTYESGVRPAVRVKLK